jgi:diguanylate cyclase (GGDEF)-like protein/PAS domain S-box-containing protein
MHILFIEENAQDYLNTRHLLDEQTSHLLKIDWAPNYEIALKQIKQNRYDVYLIGYEARQAQQQKFLARLCESTTIPTILLTKNDESVDTKLMEQCQTDFLCKEQLSWLQLKRSIRYLSDLIALQKQQKKFQAFQAIFDNAFEFMGLLKPNGFLQEINQTALTFLGYEREAVVGHSFWDMPWVIRFPKNQTQFKNAVTTAVGGKFAHCETEIQKPNGQTATLDFYLTPITNAQNTIIWILIEGHDLCERRALELQLNHSHLHDQLTGLPNRHRFIEYLDQAMARAQLRQDYHIAVLFIDLDRFRVINTGLGHDMGDWLLMEIAQRLQACLDKKNVLARSGGDEFLILLDEMPDLAEATRLAVTINKVLAGPFSLDGYEIITSCSIGIAYYTSQEEATDLLREADAAMYHAKAKGKSCYAMFRRGMHSQAVSRLQIETDLHHALEKKDFFLLYHPQMALSTEELVGAESLIRFRHTQNGFISSVDFTPVLEDTGIIITIGEWILQTACHQLKAWLDAGLLINRVAVNLSAHQFRSKHLINTVVQSLDSSDLAPECLELELTESLLLEDINSAIKTLGYFKDMGIRVTIDDFGTGYASLNYLKRFPADSLKIDKSFINGIISSPEDAAITVATIDMAHALGLTVIAEGVENIEQRDFLRDQGCDFAQGGLYAVPMENSDFLAWYKQYYPENEGNGE